MSTPYDADFTRRFYDAYGAREWERFERDVPARVNFHLHRRYLQRYIKAGDHVLEVGAGPGRFTIELAHLGATITVGDLSSAQLDLNREKVGEAGCEEVVVGRALMDVTNLSGLPTGEFDATVCYGAPLSYTFDRADDAVAGLIRVTKQGGYLLVSVASLFGTLRRHLPAVLALCEQYGMETALRWVIATGDLSGEINNGHTIHLFRWEELRALLERHGCQVVGAAAANFLSPGHEAALDELGGQPALWEAFLEAEEACALPGALDGGTHIIAIAQRT